MRKGDARNKLFWTALHRGDADTVEKLLREGQAADAPLPLGKNSAFAGLIRPLWMASNLGYVEIAASLLKFGADVNTVTRQMETPLHFACDLREAEPSKQRIFLNTLLKQGADVNARNFRNVTPLHIAVRARRKTAVMVLLAHGAEVDAEDGGRKSTPLRRAVINTGAGGTALRGDEALAITKLLLKHGANPKKKDRKGKTVIESTRNKELKALLQAAQ